MAEFLVKAKAHWMDTSEKFQRDLPYLLSSGVRSYEARTMVGDIIVVKPDGWIWGREECPPTFIVVKVLGMSYEEAMRLMHPVMQQDSENEADSILIRRRRFAVPTQVVDSVVAQGGVIEVSRDSFQIALIDKEAT